jgi:hypothetical protein
VIAKGPPPKQSGGFGHVLIGRLRGRAG